MGVRISKDRWLDPAGSAVLGISQVGRLGVGFVGFHCRKMNLMPFLIFSDNECILEK